MRIRLLFSLLAAAVLSAPASAQTRQTILGLNMGYAAAEESGFSFSLSYARVFGVVRPSLYLDMIAGPADPDSRYYRDTFDNGQSRCRDSVTGRFASDALCTGDFGYAARAEGLFRLARSPVLLGPGLRVGSGGLVPYGTAMYEAPVSPGSPFQVQGKGSAGVAFIQAEVGIALAF